MIEVVAQERPRTYTVRIGAKVVGRLHATPGYITAWANTADGEESRVGNYSTLRQAVRGVLEYLGYGRPDGAQVKPMKGIRS